MQSAKVPKKDSKAMSDAVDQGIKAIRANKNISGCVVFVAIRVPAGGCYYATGLSGQLPEMNTTLTFLESDYREILRRGSVKGFDNAKN